MVNVLGRRLLRLRAGRLVLPVLLSLIAKAGLERNLARGAQTSLAQ